VRDRLLAELEAFEAGKQASDETLEIDPETARQLRALGYAP